MLGNSEEKIPGQRGSEARPTASLGGPSFVDFFARKRAVSFRWCLWTRVSSVTTICLEGNRFPHLETNKCHLLWWAA